MTHGDYIHFHATAPRVPESSKIQKYPSQKLAKDSWNEAQRFCHVFISYNPCYESKVKAYDAAMEYHDKCVNKKINRQEMKKDLKQKVVILWFKKKIEKYQQKNIER